MKRIRVVRENLVFNRHRISAGEGEKALKNGW